MLNAVIDISDNQSYVNFVELARNNAPDSIVGVFHKATEGSSGRSQAAYDLYQSRRKLALSQNLLWGGYHYGTNEDGQAQAAHFLKEAAPVATDLLMLDFEAGGGMTAAQAAAFVQAVYDRTSRYPGLYSTVDYLVSTGAQHYPVLVNCWLWVARYDAALTDPGIHETDPTLPWQTWTMWQYTDGNQGSEPRGAVGIGPGAEPGPCDRDIFNGSLADLYRLWNCPLPAGPGAAGPVPA